MLFRLSLPLGKVSAYKSRMKRNDMDQSLRTAVNFCCVTAAIAALVPAASAQVSNLESVPQNVFEDAQEESLAKYLALGPVSVRPHLNVSAYYDDNLALSNNAEMEDFVWRIAPGALFGMGEFRDKGNYVTLDYTPTVNVFTKYHDFNGFDHKVDFNAGWKASKLTLGVGQAYEIANGKHVEVGAFVEQETYTTKLTSLYEFSDKTSAELNGRQILMNSTREVIDFPDTPLNDIDQWEIEGWGNYKQTEKLTWGAGATFGWRDIHNDNGTPTPNQTFQQISARTQYEVSEKVDVSGSIGLFFSQFQGGDDKSPAFVFNLEGSWQPMANTFVSAEVYRRDLPSVDTAGQTQTATGLRGSIRQLFLDKYSASLAGGYENSDYSNTSGSAATDRTDDYLWFRPSVDMEINERINAGVFYLYRTKDSDVAGRDYSNNQLGIFTNYRF